MEYNIAEMELLMLKTGMSNWGPVRPIDAYPFLAAIRGGEKRNDILPRLMFADWLGENGHPEEMAVRAIRYPQIYESHNTYIWSVLRRTYKRIRNSCHGRWDVLVNDYFRTRIRITRQTPYFLYVIWGKPDTTPDCGSAEQIARHTLTDCIPLPFITEK